MGKEAGWVKEAQAKTDLAFTTAIYLKNNVVSKVLPQNTAKIQGLVDQLVAAIQSDIKDRQVAGWSQKPR